jgi:hypothetical protein
MAEAGRVSARSDLAPEEGAHFLAEPERRGGQFQSGKIDVFEKQFSSLLKNATELQGGDNGGDGEAPL